MKRLPIAALEIGTTRVVALVGEVQDDGILSITGLGEVRSIGVRKSEIIDFDKARDCVRDALSKAENQADTDIRQIHLVISGCLIRSDVNRGMVHILNEDREITRKEISSVKEVARKLNLPVERDVLHSIDQCYRVDDHEGVLNPLGLVGSKLVLDMLLIHAERSQLANTMKVVQDVPLDVQDVAYAGLCASLAVLTPEQKKSGVALIDLGGGTTHVLVYANESLALAETLKIGGEHITNDIVNGLNLPYQLAERLKIDHGRALVNFAKGTETLILAPEGGFSGRTILERDLQTIIHARMDETLEMVRDQLDRKSLLGRLGAGLVLTGRGAQLKEVCTLAENVFNLPCVLGTPYGISGSNAVVEGPGYASVVGMLRYAARSNQQENISRVGSFIGKIFSWGRA